MKVPGRFMGYAFSVGDLLLELDASYRIISADGAIQAITHAAPAEVIGQSMLDFLSKSEQLLFTNNCEALTGQNRLGPLSLTLELKDSAQEKVSAFISKLPMHSERIYLVLSRPYRLGLDEKVKDLTPALVAKQRASFVDNLETLLQDNSEAPDKLLITVMEAINEDGLTPERSAQIERYLASFSVGGSHAALLDQNKYAIVHERSSDNSEKDAAALSRRVTEMTGLEMKSATIDGRTAGLSDNDRVKALALTLTKYAEGSSGFDIDTMAKGPAAMMAETSEKVAQLRTILETGSFSLVFQPIVALKTGQIHHYEALSRFEMQKERINAYEMITFAEDVGMIADYDMAVLLRAVDKIRSIRRSGVSPMIAVNVSGRSLSNAAFMKKMETILSQGVDLVEYLSLEITESAKIQDLDELAIYLSRIRGWGYKVYLDDFGAGVSGFQYLRALHVDALKIDGQYIKDALVNEMDRAFLRSMVSLCKDLNITTVGEWIETREHARLLKDIGVDYGQGYYFGKPNAGLTSVKVAI